MDRDFLLDRLLKYENVSDSTDCTDESDTEIVDQKSNQNFLISATPATKKFEKKKFENDYSLINFFIS